MTTVKRFSLPASSSSPLHPCSSVAKMVFGLLLALTTIAHAGPVTGWLQWRGPQQTGVSTDPHLPTDCEPAGPNLLWTYDLCGRGTPVVAQQADGSQRLYVIGYRGEGEALREIVACLDAETGALIWEHTFPDFMSDIIYSRYSIGAPSVDAATGQVYALTSAGVLVCFTAEGKVLWQHSLMESLGRLTFPNGRTGSPTLDGLGQVVVNAITSNWGREGPARNRFYSFDKDTGQLVWSSSPGVGPPFLKDSSFCTPTFAWRDGVYVMYATTGCGNVVAVNALTGQPLWRYQMSVGGMNSGVVLFGDTVIALHDKENVDDTGRGRMVALKLGAQAKSATEPAVLDRSAEVWRNDEVDMFTSSPVLVGDRVYQVTSAGVLHCVDAKTGHSLWRLRLGADQLHASALYGSGRLYVPTWHDGLYIIDPSGTEPQVIQRVTLAGECLGSPAAWDGKLFVHTTEKLYAFGSKERSGPVAILPAPELKLPAPGAPAALQIVPNEVLLRPGETAAFELRVLDAQGVTVEKIPGSKAQWSKWIPPTARVKAELDASFSSDGTLVVAADAKQSAGAFRAVLELPGGVKLIGEGRGRILPGLPIAENFDEFALNEKDAAGGAFAYPPLPWIGARLKWDVRQRDGQQVFVKTLDNILFMRSMVFLGHPDERDYTVEADVLSDGNRRLMSSVGVINQRYIVMLDGNAQMLKVVSNYDRLDVGVPCRWQANQWYRLKARVEPGAGEGDTTVIRAKVWLRGEAEPTDWQLVHEHVDGHRQGAPGLFGFSPASKFAVCVDNVVVTPNH